MRFLKWVITKPQWLSVSILELQKNKLLNSADISVSGTIFLFLNKNTQNIVKEGKNNVVTEWEWSFSIYSVLIFNFCQTLLLHIRFSWGKPNAKVRPHSWEIVSSVRPIWQHVLLSCMSLGCHNGFFWWILPCCLHFFGAKDFLSYPSYCKLVWITLLINGTVVACEMWVW